MSVPLHTPEEEMKRAQDTAVAILDAEAKAERITKNVMFKSLDCLLDLDGAELTPIVWKGTTYADAHQSQPFKVAKNTVVIIDPTLLETDPALEAEDLITFYRKHKNGVAVPIDRVEYGKLRFVLVAWMGASDDEIWFRIDKETDSIPSGLKFKIFGKALVPEDKLPVCPEEIPKRVPEVVVGSPHLFV